MRVYEERSRDEESRRMELENGIRVAEMEM